MMSGRPVQGRRSGGLSRPRASAGFTLLEMVVTLVLVSLLVAVLMQMLGQALSVRTRLLHYQQTMRLSYLKEGWFRDVVAASQLDDSDGFPPLRGSSVELSHVSAMPLQSGGLARVRWQLRFDGQGKASLYYAEGDSEPLQILEGPLEQARFSYRGASGEWVEQWDSGPVVPPTGVASRVGLPLVVRFQAQTNNGQLLWLVPLMVDGAMPSMSEQGINNVQD